MKKIWLSSLFLYSSLGYTYGTWDQNTTYTAGDMVTKDGVIYVSTHWSKNTPPINNENNWDGWVTFPNNNPNWDASNTYHGGDVVAYQDKFYLAKYWNNGEIPESSEAWLILIGADKPTLPTDPDKPLDPESKEAILGIDSNNNGLDDIYEAKIEETYSNEKDKELAKAIGIQWRSMLEYKFNEEKIDPDSSANILSQSSFLYACSAQKKRKDLEYIQPNQLFFTSIERSYAYRIAEIKLYDSAIDTKRPRISIKDCDNYK